jgi:TolB-like protein
VNPTNFLTELKRRNVYRAAVAYGIVAWFLTQLTTQVFPFFEIPNSAVRFVVIALAIGFPIAMLLSWLYELTPEGIVRTEDLHPAQAMSIQRASGRILDFIIIGALLLVIAMLIVGRLPFYRQTGESISQKSIAVLPFENRSEEKANAFFADGVQDEILTNLAKIADLKVISRTSVMQYRGDALRNLREVAQQLGVAHIVEGSVQRSGNRVRVNAQLVDARTDAHLWGQTYDRDLADIFAIQSEIAQKIADQLQAKLSPKEKSAINEWLTSDLAAYDLYLQAKELLFVDPARARENSFKAVQLLHQAIARDPAFLLAHCQLAYAHDLIYFFGFDHTETRLALAETSVRTAVRLQPNSGETHLAQAIHFYWGYFDYDRAREELAKAQHALPNNVQIFKFFGLIDRRQGHWDEALRNLEHAVSLDPRHVELIIHLELTYFLLRRYEEALAMCNRALTLEPRSIYFRIQRPLIAVEAEADMAPLRAVLNTIEAEGPSSAAEVAEDAFRLALRERDPAAAARALANIPSKGDLESCCPHAFLKAYWLNCDKTRLAHTPLLRPHALKRRKSSAALTPTTRQRSAFWQ